MGLELTALISQVGKAASHLQFRRRRREDGLKLARDAFHSWTGKLSLLQEKLDRARTTWLMAGVVEGWEGSHPLSLYPQDFAVLATDGSHIPPDRHRPATCYLINLGLAYLQYGQHPLARLGSRPQLYYKEEDLFLSDPAGLKPQPVEGALLEIKRNVEEARFLAEGAREGLVLPTLALMDGSLILWGLAGKDYPTFVREQLLEKGLLPTLEEMRQAPNLMGVAGYISSSRSAEVVNLLRLALCPYPQPDCDRYCTGEKPCDRVSGVEDRELFDRLLQVGERSPLFSSTSVIMKHYGKHRIFFCYLKTGSEVARLEFPCWVEGKALELVHGLAFDQCQRGLGYPVALMEAHEKAVLTPSEREQFWSLVEAALEAEGIPSTSSAKRRSKQVPWI